MPLGLGVSCYAAIALLCFSVLTTPVFSQASKSDVQVQELEGEITSLAESAGPVTAYNRYLEGYYDQQREVGDLTIKAMRWQIFASGVVLWLVTGLTTSGIVFAGYQLFVSAKLAQRTNVASDKPAPENAADIIGRTTLEVSTQKVSLQTSLVGVLILVISGAFLIVFLREAYHVRPVPLIPVAEELSISSSDTRTAP